MSIILTILKIVVMILGIILGLALLLVLAVLFVPVRYEVSGILNKEEKEAHAKLLWFFGLVKFRVDYLDSDINTKFSIFGFVVNNKKKAKNINKSTKKEAEINDSKATDSEEIAENQFEDKENMEAQSRNHERCSDDKGTDGRKGIFAKLKEKVSALVKKIKDLFVKIKKIFKEIVRLKGELTKFLNDKYNKLVFENIKKELLYILRHYKPRRVKGEVMFGTGDPASTGWALGVFFAVFKCPPDKLVIVPDFENKVIEGNIKIKGRIRSIHAALVALRLFGDRKFRRMLKFRKRLSFSINV
ncbi:MAG: DUF2953 domain-containing protein [Lachnospiraceae bacterium]|nr:DUF2953 domain-containing protein [Lachnospiraceae bacterium]